MSDEKHIRPSTTLVLVACTLTLASCYSLSMYPWGIERTRANLIKLEVNMTKEQVVSIMGAPYAREVFPAEDGRPIEILLYLTQYTDSGSIPDSDKTPVCLIDGKVIGWGRNFYDRTLRQRITVEHR